MPSGEREGNAAAFVDKKSLERMSPLCVYSVDGRCLSLRLTDGALSANIFPRDYHLVAATGVQHDDRSTSQLLPLKWMAVETLQTTNDDRQLSIASDVVRNYISLQKRFSYSSAA